MTKHTDDIEITVEQIASSSTPSVDANKFGGKAYGLHLLGKIPRVQTAPWIALSKELFEEHMRACGALELLASFVDLDRVQKAIKNHPLSANAKKAISYTLKKLGKDVHLAVRSSGVSEDSGKSSFAGLFHTELNVVGEEGLENAIKLVWASSFSEPVITERKRHGVPQEEGAMGVVIQQLVDAKAAAVVSTVVLGTGYPGIEVSANFGLGLSVVDGDVSTDSWVIHPTGGYLLESHKGTKDHIVKPAAKQGTESSQNKEDAYSLDEKMLNQIYLTVTAIKETMGNQIDVEVAFDSSGQMFTLQARPLVMSKTQTTHVIDKDAARNFEIVAESTYALPGVVSGKLVFISNWEELAQGTVTIGKGDIALAHVTTNTWSQHLANAAGLVTKEGSASSHPMLLSREKGCPCLTGIPDREQFETLKKLNGEIVTIDGHTRILYRGEVPTCEAKIDELLHQYDPITKRSWPKTEMDIESMKHNRMVIEQDGQLFRKTPTYPIERLQAEINVKRSAMLASVVGRDYYSSKTIYEDGYVACEMKPYDEYISIFRDYTIAEANAFNTNGKRWTKELLELSENFTPNKWDNFIDAYVKMRTFVWVSGALRYMAERRVDEIGVHIGLPQYYLEKASEQIQSQLDELDTKMQKEVHELATTMIDHHSVDDVESLKGTPLYEKIAILGRKYRFEHQMALHQPVDLNFTYKRLLAEIEHIKSGAVFRSRKNPQTRDYLPGQPSLLEWLKISIENRLLQSDAHHIEARVKAIMRDKLIAWRGEDVFSMSIEEIRSGKK